jgi:hypothetical protein
MVDDAPWHVRVHPEVNGGGRAERLVSGAMTFRLLLALLFTAFAAPALAAPSRIVILPAGESADLWRLCEIGAQRAKALALTYLGRDATKSLFASGEEPSFFFAVTPAGAALASPAVTSWNKPVILYSVVPQAGESADERAKALNRRTQQAARNVLANPTLEGKTVVMVWEREQIASEALEAKFENEPVTLRQLFKLDILPGVPKTWPSENHDYFWIVDFPANSNVPNKFAMMKQDFGASFPRVPANDWGTPDGLDAASGCKPEGEASAAP